MHFCPMVGNGSSAAASTAPSRLSMTPSHPDQPHHLEFFARCMDDGRVPRPPPHSLRSRGVTLACLGGVLGLVGCTAVEGTKTAISPGAASSQRVLSWSMVPLPLGTQPRTLTALGERLLVGALAVGKTPTPRMLTLDAAGTTRQVPLTPHSGYAFETTWQSVASDGTRVIAIGAASGGAHFNNRWTTWSGTTAGVQELPQRFDTFGGWGAGELVSAVVTPAGEALVGTWGGAKAGLDGAVWLSSGPVWARQDPAGTALQSTPDLLVGPRSATSEQAGILVVGSAVHLRPGSVSRQAALWRTSAPTSTWRRLDLPQPGRSSEAVSAHCTGDHCLIAGQADGSLAMWDLTGGTPTRLAGLPSIAVGDNTPLPDPVVIGRHLVQLATDRGHAVVLTRDGSSWSLSDGPDGMPTAAALVGDHLYVILTHGSGTPASLWETSTQAWR